MSSITINQTQLDSSSIEQSINIVWVVICAILVFFMQTGFAMLEAGSVRFKNHQNIIIINFLDATLGAFIFWFFGFGIAFGKDFGGFIGTSFYFAIDFNLDYQFSTWMFQWAFCITTCTIAAGTIVERMKLEAYIAFSLLMSGWIYPIGAHWCWNDNGWLAQMGYLDFAGSGVIHFVGGVSGLAAALVLGPRIGRFQSIYNENEFAPHDISLVALGTLILWVGWYGFNCGSTKSTIGLSTIGTIGRIGMNTTLGASGGAICALVVHAIRNRKCTNQYNVSVLCNGLLAGLVGVTASCNNIQPYSAFIIGAMASLSYMFGSNLIIGLQIDDPLDAIAVHGFGGFVGTIMVGWFDLDNGIFYGGGGKQFGVQLLTCICLGTWSFLNTFIFFKVVQKFRKLRISKEEELLGQDKIHHDYLAARVSMIIDDYYKTKLEYSIESKQKNTNAIDSIVIQRLVSQEAKEQEQLLQQEDEQQNYQHIDLQNKEINYVQTNNNHKGDSINVPLITEQDNNHT